MGFLLSAIVMGCNLFFALTVFSCLSRPNIFIKYGKTWGVIHSERQEQQLKEIQTIGHILLMLLFFMSILCGAILAIIQNTLP